MSIRVPLNQIVSNKYTVGKELIYESSYKEYQGYYYEMNDKIFAGREFRYDAPVLIKINSDNINILKQNPETKRYSSISNQKIFKENKVISLPVGGNAKEGNLKEINFYCKKINTNIIKRINEETYVSLQNNPLYQTTFVGEYNAQNQSIEEAEQQIPGVSDWIVSDARGF
jgi:hypothetical protein